MEWNDIPLIENDKQHIHRKKIIDRTAEIL